MRGSIKWLAVAILSLWVGIVAALDIININQAGTEALARHLSGIGPVKAQAIVDWREKYGAFSDIEQIMEVSGIGPKWFETHRERLSLDSGLVE